MKNWNNDIDGNSGILQGSNSRKDADHDLSVTNEDSALFENISDYMKGLSDLEDVREDPAADKTRDAVKEMISDYHNKIPGNKDNEKFIRDIFAEEVSEEKIIDEIINIKQETGNSDINEMSAKWVKEWHDKRQRKSDRKPETEEIKNFIKSSLESDVHEPVKSLNYNRKKRFSRTLIISYLSVSAAALIGVFILLRTLLPVYTPDKLYDSYYKPFDAMSPVTRSLNDNEAGIYASAIGSYKTGDYLNAAALFSERVHSDPASVSPRFFLGLTQLAQGDYNQAISLLTGVVNESGEFGKEAQWYLGLAYLKTGNKPKATQCFEHLAQSAGFYRERSEEILRRLK
jgi:TolA-binding protein